MSLETKVNYLLSLVNRLNQHEKWMQQFGFTQQNIQEQTENFSKFIKYEKLKQIIDRKSRINNARKTVTTTYNLNIFDELLDDNVGFVNNGISNLISCYGIINNLTNLDGITLNFELNEVRYCIFKICYANILYKVNKAETGKETLAFRYDRENSEMVFTYSVNEDSSLTEKVKVTHFIEDDGETMEYPLNQFGIVMHTNDSSRLCFRIYYVSIRKDKTVMERVQYISKRGIYFSNLICFEPNTFLFPSGEIKRLIKSLQVVFLNLAFTSFRRFHHEKTTSMVKQLSLFDVDNANFVSAYSRLGLSAMLNASAIADSTITKQTRVYQINSKHEYTSAYPHTEKLDGLSIIPKIKSFKQDMPVLISYVLKEINIGPNEYYQGWTSSDATISVNVNGYGDTPITRFNILGSEGRRTFPIRITSGAVNKMTYGELRLVGIPKKVVWTEKLVCGPGNSDGLFCMGRSYAEGFKEPMTHTYLSGICNVLKTDSNNKIKEEKNDMSDFGIYGKLTSDIMGELRIYCSDIALAQKPGGTVTFSIQVNGTSFTYTKPLALVEDTIEDITKVYYSTEQFPLIADRQYDIYYKLGEQKKLTVKYHAKGLNQDWIAFKTKNNSNYPDSDSSIPRFLIDNKGGMVKKTNNLLKEYWDMKKNITSVGESGGCLTFRDTTNFGINYDLAEVDNNNIFAESGPQMVSETWSKTVREELLWDKPYPNPCSKWFDHDVNMSKLHIKRLYPTLPITVSNTFNILGSVTDKFVLNTLVTSPIVELVLPEGFSNNINTVSLMNTSGNLSHFMIESIMYMNEWLSQVTTRVSVVEKALNGLILTLQKQHEKEHNPLPLLSRLCVTLGEWLSTGSPLLGFTVLLTGIGLDMLNNILYDDYEGAANDFATIVMMVMFQKRKLSKELINKISGSNLTLARPVEYIRKAIKRVGFRRHNNQFEYIELDNMSTHSSAGSVAGLRERMWALSRAHNPEAFDNAFNAGLHIELSSRPISAEVESVSRVKRCAGINYKCMLNDATKALNETHTIVLTFFYYLELYVGDKVFVYEFQYQYTIDASIRGKEKRQFSFLKVMSVSDDSNGQWAEVSMDAFVDMYSKLLDINAHGVAESVHFAYMLISLNNYYASLVPRENGIIRMISSGVSHKNFSYNKYTNGARKISPLLAADAVRRFPKLKTEGTAVEVASRVLHLSKSYVPDDWMDPYG
nr:MAG: 136.6KD protein [Nilaparvata lugens reovirus]